uniref:Dymeclin n=1 Tax=Alexandrium andersonii TaxID=327968 RepID=A0A7S2HJT9_9DINO
MTVLCNVSPYIKSFALESCLKLLSLVERCSRPNYIFRSAFTHHGLVFLLEMLNNIIQYQFEGNAMLIYSVLRQFECFQHLANLELPVAESLEQADGTDGEAPAEDAGQQPWAPTEAWLGSLKKKMPLQAILCLIDYLAPRIQAHCQRNDVTDQDEVLRYLRQTTMVGILPVPHPIVIRTYQASSYTAMWFTSYMWGVIFTRSQRMPLYDWKKIRLVVINQ